MISKLTWLTAVAAASLTPGDSVEAEKRPVVAIDWPFTPELKWDWTNQFTFVRENKSRDYYKFKWVPEPLPDHPADSLYRVMHNVTHSFVPVGATEAKNYGGSGVIIGMHGNSADFNDFQSLGGEAAERDFITYSIDSHHELSVLSPKIIKEQAAFLSKVVKHLCTKPGSNCHVVGSSMGGVVTLEFIRSPEAALVNSVHMLNSPLRGHVAHLDPSWGLYYANLDAYAATATLPIWSWSTGSRDFTVPDEMTEITGANVRHILSKNVPKFNSNGDHWHLLHREKFLRNVLLPAIVTATVPATGPRTLTVHGVKTTPVSSSAELAECSGTGPVTLKPGYSCSFEYAEMTHRAEYAAYKDANLDVMMKFPDDSWIRVPLTFVDDPDHPFAAGSFKLSERPQLIVVPPGVEFSLRSRVSRKIRRLYLPRSAFLPMITAQVSHALLASDGSVHYGSGSSIVEDDERFSLGPEVEYVWVTGDVKLENSYRDSFYYLCARHWQTITAFVIAFTIAGRRYRLVVPVLLLTVVVITQSLFYAALLVASVIGSYSLQYLYAFIPPVPTIPWAAHACVCLCYPQVGLWMIAFQQRDKRQRELLAMVAALKSLTFVALFVAFWAACAKSLSPGIRATVLPFDDIPTLIMCFIPAWTLYAGVAIDHDKDREEVRSVIVGCLSAALPCWGMELYWQVVPLQLALIPLSIFWSTKEAASQAVDKAV